jgi:hypothetical protein
MLSPFQRMIVTWALVAVAVGGCGGPDRPEMAPVSGTVLFQGNPVAGAEVLFRNASSPRVAQGITDSQGKFRLTTFENFDGAVLGEHQVTIARNKANPEISGASVDNPSAAYGAGMAAAAAGNMEAISKNELPVKYADPSTSGLKETVTKTGPNDFTFKLE